MAYHIVSVYPPGEFARFHKGLSWSSHEAVGLTSVLLRTKVFQSLKLENICSWIDFSSSFHKVPSRSAVKQFSPAISLALPSFPRFTNAIGQYSPPLSNIAKHVVDVSGNCNVRMSAVHIEMIGSSSSMAPLPSSISVKVISPVVVVLECNAIPGSTQFSL
jgi:hypothetical protein